MTQDEPKRETLLPALLRVLGVSDRPLSARELRAFSNLEPGDRAAFWPGWQAIDAERRGELARSLVESAEDTIELNYRELWRWLLDDSSALVRVAAIEGLWEDESSWHFGRMLDMLDRDPAPEVRAAAAMALGRFAHQLMLGEFDGDEEVLRAALMAVLADAAQPVEVRRRALESAGYFEDDEIQQQINRSYQSDEQLMRESALVAMGHSMQERWFPIIAKELAGSSPAMRYEAANAAGEMGEDARALVSKLLPLIDEADSEVALAAIWALGEIGGPAARRALERLSRGADDARSTAANEALSEMSLDTLDM